MSSLREDINSALYDYFPDPQEREGVTNHIMYYVSKHRKGAVIGGFIIGVLTISILLQWLA